MPAGLVVGRKWEFLSLVSHDAGTVGLLLNGNADDIFGKDVLNEFGPLDEAGVAAVEIVVGTDIESFLDTLDAVEIEMEDGTIENLGVILVDDGKGGTVDDIVHTEFFAEGLDEGGLSCSHLAVESTYPTFAGSGRIGGEKVLVADELSCGVADGI